MSVKSTSDISSNEDTLSMIVMSLNLVATSCFILYKLVMYLRQKFAAVVNKKVSERLSRANWSPTSASQTVEK